MRICVLGKERKKKEMKRKGIFGPRVSKLLDQYQWYIVIQEGDDWL